MNSWQMELLAILRQAATKPFGLVVSCGDREKTRQAFYTVRSLANDSTLAKMQFRFAPKPDEIWIVNGSANATELEKHKP